MNSLRNIVQDMSPGDSTEQSDSSISPRRYKRLLRYVVISMASVSLLPLLIMTAINYFQYRQAIHTEIRQPIIRLTSNSKHSLEFFLQERESVLRMIVNSSLVTDRCSREQLEKLLRQLRKSLSFGAFVDLGVVDRNGVQKCYAGPYALQGKNYKDQDWFHQVTQQGIYISDVFLGYRKSPHFVIAIRHEGHGHGEDAHDDYILRATIDTERLHEQLLLVGLRPSSDIFIVNDHGVLQSPSRRYGPVLQKIPLKVPHRAGTVEVAERTDERGRTIYVGYAYVKESPFVLMLIARPDDVMGGWFTLRAELLGFLALSCALILVVVLVIARKLVRSLRESDLARAQVFHKMEYTNKLASVGRLAAGVAHEINNPLAIINERAGLLKDRVSMSDEFPGKDKALRSVSSILDAVDRCSTITHRLLGFAKHMDVELTTIDLEDLLREVLGFLGKEATYRDIKVSWKVQDGLPRIQSDRGQLQQVFLNIINNAFAAVKDGGHVGISIYRMHADALAVDIQDDGVGISKKNLERIFEPFFTTKAGVGTGLGLSVTYGIVQKLGGDIQVESEVGKGTRFTVILPLEGRGA